MNDDVMVYVVDDDEHVCTAVCRLLRSAGFKVSAFSSGQALLAQSSGFNGTPTVVVTDLRMPGLDGIAMAERLQALPIPPAIVFLSAHGDVPAAARAMKDGAVDFLEKPVQADELFEALGRAAAASRDRVTHIEILRGLQLKFEKLTPREREVFALVASGLINKEIAWELGVCEKTIKVHRARVVEKMAARSLPDLVRMAEKLGIPVDAATLLAQKSARSAT